MSSLFTSIAPFCEWLRTMQERWLIAAVSILHHVPVTVWYMVTAYPMTIMGVSLLRQKSMGWMLLVGDGTH
jgi:hypothetical protein